MLCDISVARTSKPSSLYCFCKMSFRTSILELQTMGNNHTASLWLIKTIFYIDKMRFLVNSLVAAAAATGCRESCENTLLECIAECNDSNCISECQRHSEDCFSSCDGDVHLLIFEPSSDPDSEVPVSGNQIKFSWNRQTGSEYVQNVPLNTPPEYDVYR